MEEKQELTLESKLLKPMKDNLEKTLIALTRLAFTTKKESEITLKINIGCTSRFKDGKEWIEPEFEYILKDKIKEAKSDFKESLGFNYSIEMDDEENMFVQNINQQESLFENEEEEKEDGESQKPF